MLKAPRFSSLLAGLLLLSQGSAVSAAGFWDIPGTAWYGEAFTYLEQHGIVQGLPDGSAKPEASLTRAEALKTVIRSQEKFATEVVWFSSNLPDIPLFPDTDQFAWYAPYLEVGFLEGIMTGYPDGMFRPGNTLTVEQALVILERAFSPAKESSSAFQTSHQLQNIPGQWYTNAASEAIARNLIAPGSTLQIGKPITRAEFFSLLHRLHSIEQRGAYAFEDTDTPLAMVSPISPTLTSPEVFQEFSLNPANQQTPALRSLGEGGSKPVNQQPSGSPLPLRITPQPFAPSDPYVLKIGDSENMGSTSTIYASAKPFAVTIPALDIFDLTVTHPVDPFSEDGLLQPLNVGVGHLFSYPGSDGKVMIYAHSSDWPWKNPEFAQIFRRLNKLAVGEQIYVTFEGKLYVYEITGNAVVSPKDVSSYSDSGQEELILYTCWPPDSTKSRYLVFASPVETIALR